MDAIRKFKDINPIVVVGSINADLLAYFDSTKRIGNYVFGNDFRFNLGGKGLNQAANVRATGNPVALVGRIGEDFFGTEILNQISIRGIKTANIVRDANASTGIGHIRVNQFGEYETVVINGANSFVDFEQIDLAALSNRGAQFVLMNFEVSPEIISYASKVFRTQGCETIINFSPIVGGFEYNTEDADYLVANVEEAELLLDIYESDALALAKAFRDSGVPNVIITKGNNGVVAVDSQGVEYSIPGRSVAVENTIGAGDTFLGIFASALNLGMSFAESLTAANYAAAITCTKAESFLNASDVKLVESEISVSFNLPSESLGSERLHD